MTVTADSLLEAFPKMKREQADWLMTWLRSEKKYKLEEEQEDETTVRMKRTERFVQRIAEELHIVTLGAAILACRKGKVCRYPVASTMMSASKLPPSAKVTVRPLTLVGARKERIDLSTSPHAGSTYLEKKKRRAHSLERQVRCLCGRLR